MSERKAVSTGTVILHFLQAAVMTWAAFSTSGALRVALLVMIGLYVVGVLSALILLGGERHE